MISFHRFLALTEQRQNNVTDGQALGVSTARQSPWVYGPIVTRLVAQWKAGGVLAFPYLTDKARTRTWCYRSLREAALASQAPRWFSTSSNQLRYCSLSTGLNTKPSPRNASSMRTGMTRTSTHKTCGT